MRLVCSFFMAGCLLGPAFGEAQDIKGFEGRWRQDIGESSPKGKTRTPKELNIHIDGDRLMVTMTGPGKVHQVQASYEISGPEVTYTGLNGDEFHIRVTHDGDSLVFEGKEQERGAEYPVHETWIFKDKSEGRVLLDTKNAKDPSEPSKAVTEYERVN